ncbi:hypothetical protein GGTG_10144 [Gaeumannomyces tritici R3-111a-1]|uniref:Uncharacterized protein n=1 Tax=Gaeumannomyces tritici (strain R3-111a-1) TaxID=644352 RepID=J3P9G3_GAET3|nr:hypothetical protein GGTG_10144 [Gaeumannomyces tritici R3-111a-1]EJT73299.1 hypothetical protein GGTG_10144 [Gaeumannomyces tritici R3-111a-1]
MLGEDLHRRKATFERCLHSIFLYGGEQAIISKTKNTDKAFDKFIQEKLTRIADWRSQARAQGIAHPEGEYLLNYVVYVPEHELPDHCPFNFCQTTRGRALEHLEVYAQPDWWNAPTGSVLRLIANIQLPPGRFSPQGQDYRKANLGLPYATTTPNAGGSSRTTPHLAQQLEAQPLTMPRKHACPELTPVALGSATHASGFGLTPAKRRWSGALLTERSHSKT